MFEHLNLILFSALNAHAGLTGWQLLGAVFAAEWLIFLMPLSLVMLWLGGGPVREVALRAFIAAACALTLNALIFSRVQEARRIGGMLLPLALVVAWSRVYLGVHWPKDMAGALMVSATMAWLVCTPTLRAACGRLLPLAESAYRRMLALPIGRGWLRP